MSKDSYSRRSGILYHVNEGGAIEHGLTSLHARPTPPWHEKCLFRLVSLPYRLLLVGDRPSGLVEILQVDDAPGGFVRYTGI